MDTWPRTLLCLERVSSRSDNHDEIDVDEVLWRAPPLITVPAVEARLGRRIPSAPASVTDALADRLLDALGEATGEFPRNWASEGAQCDDLSHALSSAAQAQVLATSRGECNGCGRDFLGLLDGRGLAALEVHALSAVAGSADDRLEATLGSMIPVCAGCHRLLHCTPTATTARTAG